MRKTWAWLIAASVLVSGVGYAAQSANQGALSQGKPAGVKQAESWTDNHQLLWILGGGIVVGGIVLVATGNGHGAVGPSCPLEGCTPPPVTTTTTTTTTTSTHAP
jgi:hypothetical protein